MEQVLQHIEDIKAAGLEYLNNTMPSGNGYYDLTFLISNADFTENTEGWSLSPTHNYGAVEFYQTTFDFYQILPDMPGGKYQFTVDAFQRPGSNADVYTAYAGGTDNVNAEMYVNSTSQKIKNVMAGQQGSSIASGEYTTEAGTYVPNNMESGSIYMARNKYNNSMQGEFAAGNMRIGLRGTVSSSNYWTMADNFKLYFLGSDGVVLSLKDQLINDGFSQVTALPSDYSAHFFLLYDHDQDLAMRIKDGNHQGSTNKAMWYDMDVNPRTDKEALWTIDSYTQDGSDYQIVANATNPDYMFQTEWNASWNYRCSDNGGGNPTWGRTSFAYQPDGYWTIKNGYYPDNGYLGPWENVITDDAETALNKTGASIGHFDLFTILRGDYVKRFDQGVQDATIDNPLDITYVLENPGAERRTAIGWKSEGASWGVQSNDALVGKAGTYYFQIWNSNAVGNAELYQEISGLPEGYYRFSTTTIGRENFYLYANSETVSAPLNNNGTKISVVAQVTDGNLRVGAKAENTASQWVAFDDARLEYLGLDSPYDVNNDGKVSIADAATIVNIILNYGNDYYLRKADVDSDEVITIDDAIGIVNIILNH